MVRGRGDKTPLIKPDLLVCQGTRAGLWKKGDLHDFKASMGKYTIEFLVTNMYRSIQPLCYLVTVLSGACCVLEPFPFVQGSSKTQKEISLLNSRETGGSSSLQPPSFPSEDALLSLSTVAYPEITE